MTAIHIAPNASIPPLNTALFNNPPHTGYPFETAWQTTTGA